MTARTIPLSLLLLVSFLTGCGTPGPVEPEGTYGLDFSLPAGSETSGVVVFVVDGVNAEIFEEMLEAGELPAIRRHFVERGLYAPRTVVNTPSVTLANETSLVTGVWPGHHGITGINWFDRNTLLWRNYETIAQKNTLDGDYTTPTIFERFPARTTVSIFHQAHRGVSKFVENWTSAGPPFYFGWFEFVDRLTLWRFRLVMDIARKRREFPAVTYVYLLAPDFRAYAAGVGSEAYREALAHTDRQLGRLLADMERDGLLKNIHLALVSDHSLMDVERHFPLAEFLSREVGLHLAEERLWEQTPFEERMGTYRKYTGVLYGSGDRYWAVQVRKPIERDGRLRFASWPERPNEADLRSYPVRKTSGLDALWSPTGMPTADSPRVDLIETLIRREAVDAVAYSAAPGRVRVRREEGEVEFRQERRGGPISCHLISGEDPFGWRGHVPDTVLAGEPLGPREWLEVTAGTEFPDLPPQIVAYFRARRAGDLAVFAAPGWDFRTVNRAGHGGLRPGDMCVPMLIAGPGVPPGRVEHARTVDLVPTILQLLGRDVPPDLDGTPLVP